MTRDPRERGDAVGIRIARVAPGAVERPELVLPLPVEPLAYGARHCPMEQRPRAVDVAGVALAAECGVAHAEEGAEVHFGVVRGDGLAELFVAPVVLAVDVDGGLVGDGRLVERGDALPKPEGRTLVLTVDGRPPVGIHENVRELVRLGGHVLRALGEVDDDLAAIAVVDAEVAAGLGDVVERGAVLPEGLVGRVDVDADGAELVRGDALVAKGGEDAGRKAEGLREERRVIGIDVEEGAVDGGEVDGGAVEGLGFGGAVGEAEFLDRETGRASTRRSIGWCSSVRERSTR